MIVSFRIIASEHVRFKNRLLTVDHLATLVDLLQQFRERSARPAVMALHGEESVTWSYGELADCSTNVAHSLVSAGVGREEPIAILAPNSTEWTAAYFGIVSAGATAVPLDSHASPKDIELMLRRSGSRRLFTVSDRLADLPGAWTEEAYTIYLMDQLTGTSGKAVPWKDLMRRQAGAILPVIDPDMRASLLFTSGTTGTPKAVPLCHKHFVANVTALLAERIIGQDDRLLLPLPLHHAYPFTVGMVSALASGATVVLPAGTTGPLLLHAARTARVTAIVGVPGLYEAFLKAIESRMSRRSWLMRLLFGGLRGLSTWLCRHLGLRVGRILFGSLHAEFGGKLRILASGGAKLEAETAWKLESLGWQVLSGYGLTETAPILTFNPPRRARLESAGLPIPGVKLRVERDKDEPFGEILAFGPSVFSGYFDDPQANEAAFAEPGWYRTGDLGYLDDDGYLYIVGRANETLVLPSGKKLFPEDIERRYLSIAFIKELAILLRDGTLVALVVPNPEAIRSRGAARVEGLLREEIERVSGSLRPHERLSHYVITIETLPRTHLGKLKRHQLSEIYERARASKAPPPRRELSADERDLLSRPETKAVWDWLSARYPDRPLSLDTSPQLDLGVDSLQWIEVTLELQDRFDIRLSEEAIGRILSLRDLLTEISRQRTEPTAQPAASVDLSRWLAPIGIGHTLFGLVLYGLGAGLTRLMFGLQAKDKELVPSDRPIVLTPNHSSYLDPVVLAACFGWAELRNTYWVGWSQIMLRGTIMRAVSRAFRVLPIDPDRDPGDALNLVRAALRHQERLVWFPEGRLSPTGEITSFLPGIALVLERTGAAAVPVHISGTFEALPRSRFLPRPHKVIVTFGRPVSADELAALGQGPNRNSRIANALRNAVSELAPEHKPRSSQNS